MPVLSLFLHRALVHVYDTTDRRQKVLDVTDCGYGYRDSMFKKFPSRYIVLDVTYRLSCKESYNLEYGPLKELKEDADLSTADIMSLASTP